MKTIQELKDDFLSLHITPTDWLGDSPDRFDTYAAYASKVDSIVEFGVYTGLSTTAFLTGNPKKLRSYDITDKNLSVLDSLKEHAKQNQIDFEFIIGNSLEVDIEETDLLFIDTVHKKKHTAAELEKHADKVNRYIVFHDTTEWPGVFQAVCDFLMCNHQWRIVEHCNRGSGLTVIEKYCD